MAQPIRVELSRRAERDLRRLSPRDRRKLEQALTETLAREPLPENADDRALVGGAPWRRLRVGELRIIYRALQPGELAGGDSTRYIQRIVHRGDLERAVGTLPDP
ncbi:MAG: type II toxin-antitoxin system RelE family toxin [Thermoleophilaceae bacterium]